MSELNNAISTLKRIPAEEWSDLFEQLISVKHATLFSRAFAVTKPHERRNCAEYFGQLIHDAVEEWDKEKVS